MSEPNFAHSAVSSQNTEIQMDKKNVKTLKEFLKERKKLQIDLQRTTSYLQQQLKNKSINANHYERQLDLVLTSHEATRVEMLDLLMHYLNS
jgi:topoisomerase IA-like protein